MDIKLQSRNSLDSHAPFSIADPRALYHEVRTRATLTPSTPCLARWQSIVRRQRSPASRVGRPSLRNGTQSRAVRRPHMARSEVVPRFACSHPPRMANFCGQQVDLQTRIQGQLFRMQQSATGPPRKKGPALNGSPRCRQQVNATCRHQRVRSEEGCTLLLCATALYARELGWSPRHTACRVKRDSRQRARRIWGRGWWGWQQMACCKQVSESSKDR